MLRKTLRQYVISKIVSVLLVGTAWAVPNNVMTFAHAVAKAEGFYNHGTIPNLCHNPGDLKGKHFTGQIGLCKGGHARFADDAYGWDALYSQIEKMISGNSRIYHTDMTLRDVSRAWAGNSRVWLKNVCEMLSIQPNDTLSQYFDINRQNYVTELKELEKELEKSWDWRDYERGE